tara:strand:- start:7 stop:516 length:510 start_codon:yes stop_codon:yes gene_type:complete
MSVYRDKIQSRQRPKDPLERRMDQWFETGRQFVDGVAGNRPGQRRTNQSISSGIDNVGRWVGDKIDWFLEEEDDWREPWELGQKDNEVGFSSKKRPLEAISLRTPKSIAPSQGRRNSQEQEDLWPDESTFRVNRFKRQLPDDLPDKYDDDAKTSKTPKRPLPRSSRRRN